MSGLDLQFGHLGRATEQVPHSDCPYTGLVVKCEWHHLRGPAASGKQISGVIPNPVSPGADSIE